MSEKWTELPLTFKTEIKETCLLDQLQTLSMAANKLSGVPQDSLRGLHQLITLHFNDNNLTR